MVDAALGDQERKKQSKRKQTVGWKESEEGRRRKIN
jgi:hypothetical protein